MEQILTVTGGKRLAGTVEIPAAKNSVLPLLAASLLCETPVRLERVPDLTDVAGAAAILEAVGMAVHRAGPDLVLTPGPVRTDCLPGGPVGDMRASVLFLAPMLVRAGRVESGLPGGCRLGPRPIDIHLDGLARMGAAVRCQGDRLALEAPGGLHGVDYTLRCPSVGATETLLLAAARARGVTVLRGAAREPEIRDLADFLNACGARIQGAGEPVVRVDGRPVLGGAVFAPLPDRIVAATAACAVAAAGGMAVLRRCRPETFAPVLAALRRAGCTAAPAGPDALVVARTGPLQGIGSLVTGAYPAFPTDAAPLLAAALLTAAGPSRIRDTIFADRFACAAGFAAMGASVQKNGSELEIFPGPGLHGAAVRAQDLRGGAALAIAALAAGGESRIAGMAYIRRGYADLALLLRQLGADATEKSVSAA